MIAVFESFKDCVTQLLPTHVDAYVAVLNPSAP